MKQTGKIELLNGSFIPNTRGPWYSTQEKLHEAQVGVEQRTECPMNQGGLDLLSHLKSHGQASLMKEKVCFSIFNHGLGQRINCKKP